MTQDNNGFREQTLKQSDELGSKNVAEKVHRTETAAADRTGAVPAEGNTRAEGNQCQRLGCQRNVLLQVETDRL